MTARLALAFLKLIYVMCGLENGLVFQPTKLQKLSASSRSYSLYLHCTSSIFTLARLRLNLLKTPHRFTVTRLQPERTPLDRTFCSSASITDASYCFTGVVLPLVPHAKSLDFANVGARPPNLLKNFQPETLLRSWIGKESVSPSYLLVNNK